MTKIGFFQEDTGIVHEIPKALFDSQSATAIKISLPADLRAITVAPGLWWVRVFAPKNNPSDTTSEWSEIKSGTTLKTIPFEVGESFLRCRGVASGSFGDLILPRKDVTSGSWTAMNIAAGAQKEPEEDRLSLTTYPGAPTSVYGASTAPNFCSTSDPRTVYSPTSPADPNINTNCVPNGTGLTAKQATDGLISGVRLSPSNTFPGLLRKPATDSCSRPTRTVIVNGPSETPGPPSAGAVQINDDVLTCFMDPGVTVGTIAAKSYPGGTVIGCKIFDSPRFFYLPILQVRPAGGSNHYSIIDFRPAFITAQSRDRNKWLAFRGNEWHHGD